MDLAQFRQVLTQTYYETLRVKPIVKFGSQTGIVIVNGWIYCGHTRDTGWWILLNPTDRMKQAYPCLGGDGEPTGYDSPWPVILEAIRADGHFMAHQALDTVVRARGLDADQRHSCAETGVEKVY